MLLTLRILESLVIITWKSLINNTGRQILAVAYNSTQVPIKLKLHHIGCRKFISLVLGHSLFILVNRITIGLLCISHLVYYAYVKLKFQGIL